MDETTPIPDSPGFPIQRSVLAAHTLVDRVLTSYNLGPSVTCHLLSRGLNDVYLVNTSAAPDAPDQTGTPDVPAAPPANRKAILRVYTSGWRTPAQIDAEIALLDLLAANDLAAPRVIRRKDGGTRQALAAPEGERHAVLFSFVEGTPALRFTTRQCTAWGKLLACFHNLADKKAPAYDRPRFDLAALIDEPLTRLESFTPYAAYTEDIAYLKQIGGVLKNEVSSLPTDKPAWGLCHGDVTLSNVLFNADDKPTLIDFDLCGYGWRVYDIATLMWAFVVDETTIYKGRQNVRDAFLEGYQSERKLSKTELNALPYFVLLRHLWLLGSGIRLSSEFGVGWLMGGYFEHYIQFLREWLTEPW